MMLDLGVNRMARCHAEMEEKMELISGTTAAEQAGVHQATWGRWVAAGKAPAPVFARDNMKLYSQADVTQFLSEGAPDEEE